jgi:hypothetical protein
VLPIYDGNRAELAPGSHDSTEEVGSKVRDLARVSGHGAVPADSPAYVEFVGTHLGRCWVRGPGIAVTVGGRG